MQMYHVDRMHAQATRLHTPRDHGQPERAARATCTRAYRIRQAPRCAWASRSAYSRAAAVTSRAATGDAPLRAGRAYTPWAWRLA